MKSFINKLSCIQRELNAPKNQFNKFGGYKYRNCEDILMSVKPLLGDLVITITDSIDMVGDRFYVKATAIITDGEHTVKSEAFAREPLSKKGMDDSQLTGSASSYARKYALNGLLLIDDNRDADSANNSSDQKPAAKIQKQPITNDRLKAAKAKIKSGEYSLDELNKRFIVTDQQKMEILNNDQV